jgi:predicted amidohydrolase
MEQKPRVQSPEPGAPFTIGIIQDHATSDVAANLQRTERLVREAARKGAQIVCLKELFQSPVLLQVSTE